ncbi:MAG: Yip1 family protein [Cyanobacteria bacterium P01_D01_bin.105]
MLIVFVAGFFQSLSQIVVLFINQVRPSRFVLSLLISALFFVVGYGFWAMSTWAILTLMFDAPLSFLEMLRTLGFSYAPLAVFGVFVMLPYFGGGVFVVLSIWTLLAVVVGIESLTAMSRWDAFASAALGWVVLQLLQKTVGQPIASLGQWITNWAAGEELITNRLRLAQELYAGLRWQSPSERASQRPSVNRMRLGQRDFDQKNTWRKPPKDSHRSRSTHRSHPSLSQAILSQSLQDARERLRAENREHDR